MKIIVFIIIIALASSTARLYFWSFRAQSPSNYAETGPAFVMQEHLNGPISSEGLIYGPNGRMTNSFVAKMHGTWEGDNGTLTENFTYSNGNTQTREWTLSIGENNTFTATAPDIVGTAQGEVSGSTIRMTYTIILPEEAGGHTLNVVDWLYLTESGVIMNRSEMFKFGIKVAELVANMRPADKITN